MPNYITNVIYAKKRDMKKLLNKLTKIENGERVVDFNKIFPMPADLNIESGSMSYETIRKERIEMQNKFINPILDKLYSSKIKRSTFVNKVKKVWKNINTTFNSVYKFGDDFSNYETLLKGYFNYKRYGYKDWYDWCWDKWGTKWNGVDFGKFSFNGHDVLSFQTAWACPVNIFKELSKVAPFVVSYADEDIGNNYGVYKMENGEAKEVLTSGHQSIGEALFCKGEEEYFIPDFYGEDMYSSEEIKEYFGMTRKQAVRNTLSEYVIAKNLVNSLIKGL